MNRDKLRKSFVASACVLALAGAVILTVGEEWIDGSVAIAATPQQKSEARKDLDQVMTTLRAVDTAYASGNTAEAQTRFDQARATWDRVALAISAREAREAQLMFDGLGAKLKQGAPP